MWTIILLFMICLLKTKRVFNTSKLRILLKKLNNLFLYPYISYFILYIINIQQIRLSGKYLTEHVEHVLTSLIETPNWSLFLLLMLIIQKTILRITLALSLQMTLF